MIYKKYKKKQKEKSYLFKKFKKEVKVIVKVLTAMIIRTTPLMNESL